MSDQDLTKLTVNLIPASVEALQELQDITDLSGTDVVNRALQMYLFVEKETRSGSEFWVSNPDTGRSRRVVFE